MIPLNTDAALFYANQIALFARIYRMLDADQSWTPQEAFLMAMAVVKQQTGQYIVHVPNPDTHQWTIK